MAVAVAAVVPAVVAVAVVVAVTVAAAGCFQLLDVSHHHCHHRHLGGNLRVIRSVR